MIEEIRAYRCGGVNFQLSIDGYVSPYPHGMHATVGGRGYHGILWPFEWLMRRCPDRVVGILPWFCRSKAVIFPAFHCPPLPSPADLRSGGSFHSTLFALEYHGALAGRLVFLAFLNSP